MKILNIIIVLVLLASCTTEKKATRWFDKHKDVAAEYLNSRFPPTYTIDTVYLPVDSADYWEAYFSTTYKVDSILDELKSIPKIIYIPGDSTKINIDSVKKVIRLQILKTLQPCLKQTRVVLKEKRNLVAEYLLNKRVDSLSTTLKNVKERLVNREEKVGELRSRVFWLWIFVFLLILYIAKPLYKNIL